MKLSQLDLNLFLVFDVIYAERNLTRAAEVLSVTQPTVSNALARLRGKLNDPLFVKTSRGMTPTPFAESLANRVHDAMELLAASAHMREEFDPTKSHRVFRMSMNDRFETLAMPVLAREVFAQAPQAALRSYRSSRGMIARELASGVIDLAVDVPLENATDLMHQTLHSADYVCVVRKGHPFADKSITLDDYLEMGHVHVSGRRRGASHVDLALRAIGAKRSIKVRLQHYQSAVQIVEISDLVLTLSKSLAKRLGFVILDLPFDVPSLGFELYWHDSLNEDPTNLWLRNLAINLFSKDDISPSVLV